MYIPSDFEVTDQAKLFDFMETYSFATLISLDGTEPTASHLPLLLDRNIGEHGRLIGHMARANSLWKSADQSRVLVIFTGPHAYVSAGWYEETKVVPTWNYTAVHAYGAFEVVDDPVLNLEIARRYIETYESGFDVPWQLDEDEPFHLKLAAQIVGFSITIDRLEGKFKLSQNHSKERRQRVIQHLASQPDDDSRAVANLMREQLEQTN